MAAETIGLQSASPLPDALPLDATDAAANWLTAGCAAEFGLEREGAGHPQQIAEDGATDSAVARRIRRRLPSSSGISDAELGDVVSFKGQKDLLRGTPLSSVMSWGAAIFSAPKGSAATYAMSETVTSIDAFLSHNWAVRRIRKSLCLALHFNLHFAVLTTMIVLVLIPFLVRSGIRPLMLARNINDDPSAGRVEYVPGCMTLVPPIFFCALFFGNDVRRFCGFRRRMVFLDKTCIHQEDQELQRKGILKLGAFLRSSSQMVVIYSDIYLTKLWTIYEVACFLSLRPASELIVVPIHQPVVIFVRITFDYTLFILYIVLGNMEGSMVSTMVFFTLMRWSICMMLLRGWAKSRKAIHDRVATFRVESCSCFCQDDRPLVYHNIAVLMRALGVVGWEATEQAALSAFNVLVRSRLAVAVTSSVGRIGMGYLQVITIGLVALMPAGIDRYVTAVHPEPPEWFMRHCMLKMLWYVNVVFGRNPLDFAMMSWWCSLCLHLRTWQEWGFIVVGSFVLWLLAAGIESVDSYLLRSATRGSGRDAFVVAYAAYVATLISLSVWLYAWKPPQDDESEEQEAERVRSTE